MITSKHQLNLSPNGKPLILHVSQYDTKGRTFIFELISYQGTITLDPSTKAAIRGTKPDGKGFDYVAAAIDTTQKTVTVNITQQMTAIAGKVICELYLFTGTAPSVREADPADYKQVATANFILMVEPTALDIDTVQSDSEIRQLVEITEHAQDLIDSAKKLEETANTAIKGANTAASNANTKAGEANTAATNANKAKDAANAAASAATESKKLADDAATSANNAANAANTAKTATEAATKKANDAATAATTAKANAETATTAANKAAENANAKATAADTATGKANTAAASATSAAEAANTAADEATEAKEQTEAATTAANAATEATKTATAQANAAAKSANDAAASATTAKTQAETATTAANKATQAANTAAESANSAAESATTAASQANTAKDNAEAATQKATTAATAAESAASEATEAAGVATSAADKANTSAGKADTAASNAGTKANAAEQAATAATNATSSATDAASEANTAADLARKAAELANNAAAGTGFLQKQILEAKPEVEAMHENILYLVPAERESADNVYDEYMLVDGKCEKIGDTAVDLSGYAKTETMNTELAKKLGKNEKAVEATKATQDSAGNNINTTYIKALSASGKIITYTRGDGSTGTITTQDTTYSQATDSQMGLTKLYGETGQKTDGAMTQKATTDAINGIEIGGRNLVLDSEFSKDLGAWTSADSSRGTLSVDDSAAGGRRTLKLTCVSSGYNNSWARYTYNPGTFVSRGPYTASVWIYSDGATTGLQIETNRKGAVAQLANVATAVVNGWKKFTQTFTMQEGDADIQLQPWNNTPGKNVYIWHPKLELGNKATDWTPAPEDMATVVALNGMVKKAGDTMTGNLNIKNKIYLNVDNEGGNVRIIPPDDKVSTVAKAWEMDAYNGNLRIFAQKLDNGTREVLKLGISADDTLLRGKAEKLETARAIKLSGGVTGTTQFDGSADATINVTALDATKLSAAVPIEKGGTGATTADAARTALGAAASSHTHNYAGSLTAGGAANTAVKLATARTISLTGAVTGSGSFDGSGDVSIATTMAASSIPHVEHGATATNEQYNVQVTFKKAFSTVPSVVATPSVTDQQVYITGITTNGFTLRSNRINVTPINWIAIGE